MKNLLIFFIATVTLVCANSTDYDVVIEDVEYRNVPVKYVFEKYQINRLPMTPNLKNTLLQLQLEGNSGGIHAVINEYADEMFANIRQTMIRTGFDPVEMPDMHTGFNFTFLFIRYHGELDLTKGWLTDLSTIRRGGDVDVKYSSKTKYLEVTVPITFKDLMFSYDYSAKLMNLGPKGGIEGKISNLKVRVKIGFDCEKFEAVLDEFHIINSGHISFKFTGHILTDWLINILSGVTTTVLKKVILLVVEGIIGGTLSDIVDAINYIIGSILNASSTVTPAVEYMMRS